MRSAVLAALAALMLTGAAPADPPVAYRLGLAPAAAGEAPHVEVEIRFRGDADGVTRLDLPDDFASGRELWRHVTALSVDGATMTTETPASRVLKHEPGAALTVRYRVATAYPKDPEAGEGNPYRGPIMRPGWFALLGEFVFVTPHGREGSPATFRWGRLPAGWKAAASVEGARFVVDDLEGSVLMGGSDVGLVSRPIAGGTLKVITRGGQAAADGLAGELAPVISAQRRFWNDLSGPYLVALVNLAPAEHGRSLGGTGRYGGFVLYTDGKGSLDGLRQVIAHEHVHNWIPRRIGELPQGAEEPSGYWFSEGFTEFYTHRTLAAAGLWTPEQFADAASGVLHAYETSEVRTASNRRIVADFWKDRAVKDLPYQRGYLLALKWDEDLRRASQGRLDLDDVIFEMRDRHVAARPGGRSQARAALVAAAKRLAGVDLAPDLARYVDAGEAIPLPAELFGGCLRLTVTSTRPWDPGFELAASIAAKQARGVRARGPAYAAGLRDGMRLEGWSVWNGDPQREIELHIVSGEGEKRKIVYWPHAPEPRDVRALQLNTELAGPKAAACAGALAGRAGSSDT